MTDYLNFRDSTEISETGGSYPQVLPANEYDIDSESSILNIADLETKPGYKLKVPDFILSKSSKLTDVLGFNGDFFIISPKVTGILKNFKLPPNEQFDCMVRQGDKRYPYLILFFYRNKYDYTDYRKSKFTLRFRKKKEKLKAIFTTKKNFEKEAGEAIQLFTNLIYFDTSNKNNFDIFKVNKYQNEFFISEKMRKVFIDNNVTGIDYLDNIDTIFSPSSEKEITEKYTLFKEYFLNRKSFYSNGKLCRQFNSKKNCIEVFNRTGKKESEMLLQKGDFKGSERIFYANGHIKIEKLVKSNLEVVFRYYFKNGQLNYEVSYHDKKGVSCIKVFDMDGKELKKYGLKNGTGKILHFNANGKGGNELVFKKHELTREKKISL